MRLRNFLTLSFIVSQLSSAVAQDLVLGGDISMLPRYEETKVAYLEPDGTTISDVLAYVKADTVGWNSLRVRLFVNPQKKDPSGANEPKVCQTLDYVTALGSRIKAAGFSFLLDICYSDTWADPAYQTKPAAWEGLSVSELTQKVYDYTADCLRHLNENGATPDYIQVGNEISYGMLWPEGKVYVSSTDNWTTFRAYLKSGIKACRELCPNAKIVIHTERTADAATTASYYEKLVSRNIDFDIIGLSYYPVWHNGLSTLANTLAQLKQRVPSKQVHIVETAYNYQYYPSDAAYDLTATWAATPDGQAAFARDLVAELKKHDNVTGLYWWFPEENGNGPATNLVINNWLSRGLWNARTHHALPALYALRDYLPAKNKDDEKPVTPKRGDVNGDGKVDVADIATIITIMASE